MNAIQANSQFQTTSLHGTGTLPLAPFSNVAKCLRSQDQPSEDPRYGWVVVAAAAICMAFGNGPLLTISVFLSRAGIGLGGWQGGILFDLSGDYSVSFAVALFAGIVNIAVLGALWLRLHRRSEILGTEASVPSARYWRGWLSEGTSLIRKGTTILRAPIANRA